MNSKVFSPRITRCEPLIKHSSGGPSKIHRIMIIEDNLDQLQSLAMVLREMGHNVDFATNGYVAYDANRRFRPDTVICDLGIPGMSGYEIAEQVRKDPELTDVRLVAFTGYSEEKYRERALRAGFDEYHVKPVDPQILHRLFGDVKAGFAR